MAILNLLLTTLFCSFNMNAGYINNSDISNNNIFVYYDSSSSYIDRVSFDYSNEYVYLDLGLYYTSTLIFGGDNDNFINFTFLDYVDTLELPYYSTIIDAYEINMYLDDWTISSPDNFGYVDVDLSYNFYVSSYDVDGNLLDEFTIYHSYVSRVDTDYNFNVDNFLFYYTPNLFCSIGSLSETYNSLVGIEGNAWENGYEAGTEDGYQQGLIEGRAENTAIFDVLDLIGGAFTAIGSLLAIQILPNIYLGTLIFVPIVILVIGVIIKLTGK